MITKNVIQTLAGFQIHHRQAGDTGILNKI